MKGSIHAVLAAMLLSPVAASLAADFVPEGSIPASMKDLESRYEKSIETAQTEFRHGIAKLIASADRVEIFLLDFDKKRVEIPGLANPPHPGQPMEVQFPMSGAVGEKSKILSRRILNDVERKAVLAALTNAINNQDGSTAMCHFPIHGLRIFQQGALIYEGSLCWHCHNFTFPYPSLLIDWLKATPELEKIINELMPIPEAERKRFENFVSPAASPRKGK